MPDPNITLTAIQSHATMLEDAIGRSVANVGRYKIWSAAIVAGVMLLAAGKAQMAALPWAAGVVVLLALADAGQGAMARVFTDAYNRFMRKLPLNGGNAMKAEEFMMPSPELGWRDTGKVLGALASFSVWPFYSALLALLVAFHVQTSQSATQALQSANGKSPSASGVSQSGTKPSSGTVRASLPMNVTSQPATRGAQPRQTPVLSPLKPLQQQPGVRFPVVPPARLPQNGGPMQNGAPQNANADGVSTPHLPPQNGVPQIPNAGGTPALQPPALVPAADRSPPLQAPAKAPAPAPEDKP